MSQPVLYEDENSIVILTLNQPELRNPISDAEMRSSKPLLGSMPI